MSNKHLKYMKDFIHAELDKRNWSERRLSEASGINPTTVNNFLKDPEKDIRLSTLIDIATALGFKPFELLMTPEDRVAPESTLEARVRTLEEAAARTREADRARGQAVLEKLQKKKQDEGETG